MTASDKTTVAAFSLAFALGIILSLSLNTDKHSISKPTQDSRGFLEEAYADLMNSKDYGAGRIPNVS